MYYMLIAPLSNDVIYTFKAYCSPKEFLMDVAQSIQGLANVLRGLSHIVVAIIFLGNTLRYAFISSAWSDFLTT